MSAERPRLLILETSSRCGLVGLAEGEMLLGVRRLEEARRHTRDLVPAVRQLLDANGWRPAELNAVVVGLGPGSYTGLRVGIMSAKALCYATGAALIGVETFAALAFQAPADVGRLDVLADAQQERIYLQSFRRDDQGAMIALAPLRICAITDWLADRTAGAWVSGPGVDAHVSLLPSTLSMLAAELRVVQANSLLQIGFQRFTSGQCDDLWKVEPLYLRPSAAEEQWRRRYV